MLTGIVELYTAYPALFAAAAFVIGLMVGSFLNVVIYRLPIMMERDWRAQAADVIASAASPGTASNPTPAGAGAAAAPAEPFTLAVPRSACPACKAPIKAIHNIPVISWLLLRGRCAACKAPISPRYPAVELATGILSAWVAWHFGFGAAAACAIPVTWALIALTGIDMD